MTGNRVNLSTIHSHASDAAAESSASTRHQKTSTVAAGTPRFSPSDASAQAPKQPTVAEKSSVVAGSSLYLRDVLEVEELCVLVILLSTQVLHTDRWDVKKSSNHSCLSTLQQVGAIQKNGNVNPPCTSFPHPQPRQIMVAHHLRRILLMSKHSQMSEPHMTSQHSHHKSRLTEQASLDLQIMQALCRCGQQPQMRKHRFAGATGLSVQARVPMKSSCQKP